MEVTDLTVLGLATDYCVKFTVLDALELSYKVTVVVDAIRGVELREGDCASSLQEMSAVGAMMLNSADLPG
jgi:nicotinamidase/pyrazinamidase